MTQDQDKKPVLIRMLISIFEFNFYENIFGILFFSFISYAFYLVYILQIYENQMTKHSQFESKDFLYVLILMIVIHTLRQSLRNLSENFFMKYLDFEKYNSQNLRKFRSRTMKKLVTDLFLYLIISSIGYYILKDQDYLSPYLFGSKQSQCSNIFSTYPQSPPTPYLKQYYLLQLSIHTQSFLEHLFINFYEQKYYEFLLHHGMAFFLILFSYLTNATAVGAVVLFIHDFSDIFLCLLRVYADLAFRIKTIVDILFVMTASVWFYFRILVFPACVIRQCIHFSMNPKYEGFGFQFKQGMTYLTIQLSMLFLMHIYWFLFLIKAVIFYNQKNKRQRYDTNKVQDLKAQ